MDKSVPQCVIVKGKGSAVPPPEPKKPTGLKTAYDLVAFEKNKKAYKEAKAKAEQKSI